MPIVPVEPSKELAQVLNNIQKVAKKYNNSYITVELLAYVIINFKSFKEMMIAEYNCDWENFNKQIETKLKEIEKYGKNIINEHAPVPTQSFDNIIEGSCKNAARENRQYYEIADVVECIINVEESYTSYLFKKHGMHGDEFIDKISNKNSSNADSNDPTAIKKYLTNLNYLASRNKIDPLIGRSQELEELEQVLCKRNKSNILMVGDPGVGKTAIAEGLAEKIVKGEVPDFLKKSTVYSLDIGRILAGTRYRGDFEERIKDIFDALHEKKGSIVFIDEAHSLSGAGGGGSSGLDFAQMIKPHITKGLKVIASTTWEEYNQSFEKDRALMRRFYRLSVSEPTPKVAKDILKGLKKHFEEFHKSIITDEAVESAVELSIRYQADRKLPDKAIDLIDTACAKQKRLGKENFTINRFSIIDEIAKITKIPVEQIKGSDNDNIDVDKIKNTIKSKLFGQDEAVDIIMDKVTVAMAGLKTPDKPIGSYLFVGPTGVGKTETAKRFGEELQMNIIRFDMSEYQERHTISRLIGSPPGYIGYNDGNLGGGLLVGQVQKNPNSILLFDEIEKAHPDLTSILLALMDEGFITGASGMKADARNCIILMTSNLGAEEIRKTWNRIWCR